MDAKGRERGILKLEPRPRSVGDARSELTPQGSYEHAPISPQPSVDRLSVTWADPDPSMASSGVNLFHLPSETPISNEVKFSPNAGEGSDDEDYSASLSAVLRQRRASVRRSRKGRARRPSSPFLADDTRPRRRSSVFTTSSGDTAISMEESQPTAVVTQEQIFENIHVHKEVLGSVKQQPLGMRRKLKIVHQAKAYIKRHEGQLQERLAQSKCTRDIYARFNIVLATKWQQLKREAANTSNLLIPWELRIKEIESHFGSVVASYFTFLRWLFWVNLVIGFILLVFVIVPEYLTANPQQDGERKIIMEDERGNATNLLMLWEFEGILKFSPIFYGYYSNLERAQYRMPLAYFMTGLAVYIYSFVAILRKMAENSRMSKLSEKEDECIFSWKLFTGWDFMIGNAETAHNRIASVILGFKEALLEEAEKKKDLGNWRMISLRAVVNICVLILLAVSAYAVVTVVSRSDDTRKPRTWWRENETTAVVTLISISFPLLFELLGLLEHYHPRKQLRLQLARIMLLNLLNLYSLIFALFSKIEGMSTELGLLKPVLNVTANETPSISETLVLSLPEICTEEAISCEPCNILPTIAADLANEMTTSQTQASISPYANNAFKYSYNKNNKKSMDLQQVRETSIVENLIEQMSNSNEGMGNNGDHTLKTPDTDDTKSTIVYEDEPEITLNKIKTLNNIYVTNSDNNKAEITTTVTDAMNINNEENISTISCEYQTQSSTLNDNDDETTTIKNNEMLTGTKQTELDAKTMKIDTTEWIADIIINEQGDVTNQTKVHIKNHRPRFPITSSDYETSDGFEKTTTDNKEETIEIGTQVEKMTVQDYLRTTTSNPNENKKIDDEVETSTTNSKEDNITISNNNTSQSATLTESETTTISSIALIHMELTKLRLISENSSGPTYNGTHYDYYDYTDENITTSMSTSKTLNDNDVNYTDFFSTNKYEASTQVFGTNTPTTVDETSEELNNFTESSAGTTTDLNTTATPTVTNSTDYTDVKSTTTSKILETDDDIYTETNLNFTTDLSNYTDQPVTTSFTTTNTPEINNNNTELPTTITNKADHTETVNDFSSTSSDFTITKSSFETGSSFSPTATTVMDSNTSEIATTPTGSSCPNFFNCTMNCGGENITQVFVISNCKIVERRCYVTRCERGHINETENTKNNITAVDIAYMDNHNRKMYNLTTKTRKKLLKLCWETMFGQELVKLTMMDLVFVLLSTLLFDFIRALFVRYMNRCWCWDLEKRFPEYGDFKIAENILHLINNQGMVWMGMFFSPGLVVLNVAKLMLMMYLRSWAVMTCNVPHAVVFRVSKSNNFYLALLLTMLFLCVLPVGYAIVCVTPSWHCGPFSEYDRIYKILTNNIYKILPKSLNFAVEYIASPAIVIPLLVLLVLIIYYLTSLTNSLREANNDLKIQLRRERTEERRKMFQLADTRRRVGSSAMDNTPFAKWKRALPALGKSIDSDDRKTNTADDSSEPLKAVKKKGGGIFAKIVGMAVDKNTDIPEANNVSQSSNNVDDETDTDFHETLPKEVLKIKDITFKSSDNKKKTNVEFKTDNYRPKLTDIMGLKVKLEKEDDRSEKKANIEKQKQDQGKDAAVSAKSGEEFSRSSKRMDKKQVSETSTQSRQSDSTIGSVIPVITISTTESDEETLQSKKKVGKEEKKESGKYTKSRDKEKHEAGATPEGLKRMKKGTSDLKSLRRQSSVDSINEQKSPKEKKSDEGHKYQYSL